MSLQWVAEQIRAVREAADMQPPPLVRFNPRPPGVIRDGSTTDLVRQFLQHSPARWFTSEEIIGATGRSHAAVSWALLYLRDQGLIDAFPDTQRNPRFLRYRFKKD